jgi:hypothetical protein
MKTKMTMKFKIGLGAMACMGLALTSARALPIDLSVNPGTTPYVLGDVNPPKGASAADDIKYINGLIGLSLGGSAVVDGDTVFRSDNSFGSLTTATKAGDASGTQTSITLATGYEYLVAKYGGPNGGMVVWDIASIAAGDTLDIPTDAYGANNDKYSLSGWRLFDALPSQGVPDGGLTAMLLGIGLLGLALMRRYLSVRPGQG